MCNRLITPELLFVLVILTFISWAAFGFLYYLTTPGSVKPPFWRDWTKFNLGLSGASVMVFLIGAFS